MSLAETVQRSQPFIDSLANDLSTYMQKKRQADATNEFYGKLRALMPAQQPIAEADQVPTNAPVTNRPIPQQAQATSRENMNAPVQAMPTIGLAKNPVQATTQQAPGDRMSALRQYLMQNPEKLSDPNVAPLIQQEFSLNSLLNPEPDLMAMHPGESAYDKRTHKMAFEAPAKNILDKVIPGSGRIDPDTHHKFETMQRADGSTYEADRGVTIVPEHETPEHKEGVKVEDEKRKSQEAAKKKFRDATAAEAEYRGAFDPDKAKAELAQDRDFAEIMKLPAGERAAALMNPNINPEKRQRYQMYVNYLKHGSDVEAAKKELKDAGLQYDEATDDFVPIEKQSKKQGKQVATNTQTKKQTQAPSDTTGAPLDDLFK